MNFPSFVLAIVAATTCSHFEEPCEEFLQALRDRGYHDVALDYLEEMEDSPLASSSFKAALPFEKAQTLISSTTRIKEIDVLEERLGNAESLLSSAESNARDPELKARAQNYRGDLLFRRARIYLGLADNDRLTANEKSRYNEQAREYLNKALDAFTSARDS